MHTTITLSAIINIIGTVMGVFVSFVILGFKKGRKTTNILLALFLLSYSLIIFSYVLWQTKLYYSLHYLIGIFPHFYFALGPLLYMYIKALTSPDFTFKKKYILHFTPVFICILYLFPYYFWNIENKISRFEGLALHTSISYHIMFVARLIHLTIYLLLTFQLLKFHLYNIKKSYSFIERKKLNWVRHLIIGLGLLLAAYILFYAISLKDYGFSDPFSLGANVFSIWQTCIIFFIAYNGLIQPEIFMEEDYNINGEKYKFSTLTKEQSNRYLKYLLDYMNLEKPYLNSELTLKDLANDISIPYPHLSQVINEQLEKNFFEFVNQYRITEAKHLLTGKKNKNYSILRIAFDSGFNSKSAFYQVFKKFVRMTPSQFISRYPYH